MSPRTGSGLAFSTLGCPGEPIEAVAAHAKVADCTGIELRCRAGELIAPDSTINEARALKHRLAEVQLIPVCLASYVLVGEPGDHVVRSLEAHIELAGELGAPFVRVFGGDPADQLVPDRAINRLRAVAGAAAEAGVSVLIETHDALLEGRSVAHVLEETGVEDFGAVWDLVNPWRAGEAIVDTAEALRPWLRHVQIKDVASPNDLRPLIPGQGAVPLEEVLAVLADQGYRFWVSLEWEAAWYPDAAPLDDALAAFHTLMMENNL